MLPIGAFSFSHGLEAAVSHGLVCDASGLKNWLEDDLRHGAAWNDAVFFKIAWDAARLRDLAALRLVAQYAAAYRGTAELFVEATEQGRATLEILTRVWPDPLLTGFARMLANADVTPTPSVVLAVRMATEDIELEFALPAFLQAYCGNLVASAIRLMPIGQTAGQEVIRDLEPTILSVVDRAMRGSLEDVGSAAIMIDLMSITHETQASRLFRS